MSPAADFLLRDSRSIAALIDHTLLRPEATRPDIERICKEARANNFACVCVNPVFVPFVAAMLHGSQVKACAVVGFPLGANLTEIKVAEAQAAIRDGASEIDMVIHIGGVKSLADNLVSADIRAVCQAAHQADALCKVIIETCLLTHEEKERACRIAVAAGADYVKTSTGFNTSGATVEDVALMRSAVGSEIGVKASGGIRSLDDLLKMVDAGASRIGSSNGVRIVEEARLRFGS